MGAFMVSWQQVLSHAGPCQQQVLKARWGGKGLLALEQLLKLSKCSMGRLKNAVKNVTVPGVQSLAGPRHQVRPWVPWQQRH